MLDRMRRRVTARTAGDARATGDAGFTLIEVIVAMSIFAVAASITATYVVRTSDVTRGNLRRTTAANVGASVIEAVRTTKAVSIPDGTTTLAPRTVGNTTYTITQTAKYVTSGSNSRVCSGTGTSLAYKLVTVKVTWPNMGSTKPVRLDTLKAVTLGTGTGELSTSTGSLAIQVSTANGGAVPDVPVTVTMGGSTATRTTEDDGCVVFTGLAAGTWSASASVAGYAGTTNVQAASIGSLGVTAGGLARGTLYYDVAGSVAVSFDAAPGTLVPSQMPLRIGGTFMTEYSLGTCPTTVVAGCTTGVPGTIKGIFPDNWTVKVGSCVETTPSSATIDLRSVTGTQNLTLPVAAPTVTIKNLVGGAASSSRTITLRHNNGTGCASGETYTVTSTGTAAGTRFVLPYGTWTISTTSVGTAAGTLLSSTVTLSATNKNPTIALTVVA